MKLISLKVDEELYEMILEKKEELDDNMSNVLRILIAQGIDKLNGDGTLSTFKVLNLNAQSTAINLVHDIFKVATDKVRKTNFVEE